MSAEQDMKEFTTKVQDTIDKALNRRALRNLGEMIADMIRQRTRKGYGVSRFMGPKQRLKRLSPSYIKQRKRMRLSPFTSPRKSNLTKTGAMLEDLRPRYIQAGRNKSFKISFNKGFSKDKAGWAVEKGRPFNNLSKSEFNQVLRWSRDNLDRVFRSSSL